MTGNGTLALMAPALSAIGSAMGFGTVSREVFSWPSFGAGVDAQFRYRPAGGGAWTSLPVVARTKGHDGVDWAGLGGGAFDYELLLIDKQTGAAYAHATGRIDKQAAVPDRWVPPIGIAPIAQALTLDSGNTSITWAAPGEYTGVAVLKYRLQGTSGWSQVTMSRSLAGGGEGGEGGENGSLVTRFTVAFGTLPAGNYDYDLVYTPFNSNAPTLHRIGTISQGATTPGYYYTRYYTVSVPVQVWVPPVPGKGEGGEGGQPGYWRVEWREEQRSEQVWVPPVVPRPGMTQAAAPYTPGYTIKGSPVQYGMTSTTASNPGPISVAASGNLGVVGTWTPVGANNGGTQASRPTVQRTYDRWGNVQTVTDPRSPYWVTSYTYNASNQMTSEIRPNADGVVGAGPKTYLYYDQNGNNVATRDANGNVNGNTYDAGGNRIRETHADGGVYRYNYNALGDKVAWIDALGHTTNYSYDNLGRLVLTSLPGIGSYKVSNVLDLQYTGSRTVIERVTYDELGNKLSSTNGAGETTYFRYDLRGNVTGIRKPGVALELRTAYDARGNKTFEADANGNAATWGYDYFGRLVAHTDIGGAQYAYSYDNARQLLTQTNTRGQSLTYVHDAAGQMTRITDASLNKITDYAYDHAGNKVRERTMQANVVYQSNVMAYDALGRLREVSDGYLRETIDYDANGNRTRVQTQYTDGGRTVRNRDLWYGYDAMNRQTTVDGVNANLDIGIGQGHKLAYDVMGNRISDRYWGKAYSSDGVASDGFTNETYTYDEMNRLDTIRRDGLLTDRRYYDGADRVVTSGISGEFGGQFYERSGLVNERKMTMYDAAGRVSNVRVLSMTAVNGFTNKYNSAYTGYDGAGNVTQYKTEVWEGSHYINTYNYTHARYEGYREATLSGTSTKLDPGLTTYKYDVNGNLIGVTDSKETKNNQTLVNDANGKILQRVQDGKITRTLIVNGEMMGSTGPAVGADDFSPSFRPIDGGNPSAAPGSYRIQAGDTLQSIAQQAFGDSRLWYLIAEANGLSGDRDLRVGATVTVPNRVTGNHNDYKTFKPYDPGKLIGDTQPTMPVPKADGGGCGGIGMIIVAVVAVVATVLTAGAMAPATVAATAAAAAGTTTALGTTVAAGVAMLGGAAGFATSVGVGLVAGAVGSIASQGVGMAIGAQSKFNWNGVALSGLSTAASAGVASSFGGTAGLSKELGTRALQTAGRAMVSSTLTQGIAVATGLQSKFSWTNVAAAGVGAGVGSAVSSAVMPDATGFAERMTRGFVAGATSGVAASVLSGGKADYVQIATDAFGNALGNSIVDKVMEADSLKLADNQKTNRVLVASSGGFDPESVRLAFQSLDESRAKQQVDLYGLDAASEQWMRRFDSGARPSVGLLQEMELRSLGMGDALAGMAWEALESVNDSLWTVANAFSGGHLAENVYVAREAVARNNARGAAMFGAAEQLAGAGLRLGTGNMSPAEAFEATGQHVRDYLQIDRGLALEASGDSRAAQAIWGRSIFEIGGATASVAGMAGKAAALGAGASRTLGVGLRISAEDFGASSIGQRVAGAADSYMARMGLRLNALPDGIGPQFVARKELSGSDIVLTSERNIPGIPVPRVNVADDFVYKANKNGSVTLQYGNPDGVHGLIVNVDRQGILGFDIRSTPGNSFSDASGTDMFASAMQRLQRENVQVNAIRGVWIEGGDSVNAAQYLTNLNRGLSPQNAAADTWTGRMAARYGYTNVGAPSTGYSSTTVIFGR